MSRDRSFSKLNKPIHRLLSKDLPLKICLLISMRTQPIPNPMDNPNPIDNPSGTIELQVNGEAKTCSIGTSLPNFLIQVGFNPKLIAVEYNGEILARPLWETTLLQAGDRLEIVTIVGGG